MRFYIVDDDINVVKILKNIIEQKTLGEVVGFAYDGEAAVEEIKQYQPDIVLIDYLMPNKDGRSVVGAIKKSFEDIHFIVISQVSDKDMISDIYEAGISFYIQKPLNIIEIERVIYSVKKVVEATRTIQGIKSMLNISPEKIVSDKPHKDHLRNIKLILSHLGILGEKGSYDIVDICEKALEEGLSSKLNINSLYQHLEDDTKVIKQRIRRSIYIGLTNIANLGLEDYMNDYFVRYANSLYDFESVKAEMDYIRKKRSHGGKVNINKFIECLLIISEFD